MEDQRHIVFVLSDNLLIYDTCNSLSKFNLYYNVWREKIETFVSLQTLLSLGDTSQAQ